MTLPDFYKGYYKEGAAMRKKTKVKSTKGGQTQKLSNISPPTPKPKFKGNTDSKGNPTNLKTAKYYKGGGNIVSCR